MKIKIVGIQESLMAYTTGIPFKGVWFTYTKLKKRLIISRECLKNHKNLLNLAVFDGLISYISKNHLNKESKYGKKKHFSNPDVAGSGAVSRV
jgi:hypothetical protein